MSGGGCWGMGGLGFFGVFDGAATGLGLGRRERGIAVPNPVNKISSI
jgi:hypothetical protein